MKSKLTMTTYCHDGFNYLNCAGFLAEDEEDDIGEAEDPDSVVHFYAGDHATQYSHDMQLSRAAAVDRQLVPSRCYGVHSTSRFLSSLPYTNANNLWVIPIAHALLYGAVKDFWKYLLAPQKAGMLYHSYLPTCTYSGLHEVQLGVVWCMASPTLKHLIHQCLLVCH